MRGFVSSRCTDRCILHDRLDLKEIIRRHDIVIINKYDDVAPRFADTPAARKG